MVRNTLITCGPEGAADYVGALAVREADDVGLVHTCIDPASVKTSGGRIEEERSFGGQTVSAFDEPLSVGTAVAQLAGFADSVIVDRLDDWAARLAAHYADDEESIEAELTALKSVMDAGLVDLFLLTRPLAEGDGAAQQLTRRVIELVASLSHAQVDATGAEPVVVSGALED